MNERGFCGVNQEISSLSFSLANNVRITVIDKKRHIITKEVKVHNKATRNMVAGILRFIMGNFTTTYKNQSTIEYANESKLYIPCYVGVGYGGIMLNPDGSPKSKEGSPREPDVSPDWTTKVSYLSNKLEREFIYGRSDIGKVESTLTSDNVFADMDTIIFRAEIPPNKLSMQWTESTNVFVSEFGLFPTYEIHENPDDDMLLAHVKLSDEEILFVRPQDTIELTWSISIVAVGRDSTLVHGGTNMTVFPNVGGGVTITTS